MPYFLHCRAKFLEATLLMQHHNCVEGIRYSIHVGVGPAVSGVENESRPMDCGVLPKEYPVSSLFKDLFVYELIKI